MLKLETDSALPSNLDLENMTNYFLTALISFVVGMVFMAFFAKKLALTVAADLKAEVLKLVSGNKPKSGGPVLVTKYSPETKSLK